MQLKMPYRSWTMQDVLHCSLHILLSPYPGFVNEGSPCDYVWPRTTDRPVSHCNSCWCGLGPFLAAEALTDVTISAAMPWLFNSCLAPMAPEAKENAISYNPFLCLLIFKTDYYLISFGPRPFVQRLSNAGHLELISLLHLIFELTVFQIRVYPCNYCLIFCFLVACTRLYMPLCLSVHPSVHLSVGPSIHQSITICFFWLFYAILSHLWSVRNHLLFWLFLCNFKTS